MRYAWVFEMIATPAVPLNLSKGLKSGTKTCKVREDVTYPEIHSLRLSDAATYSDPCASSLGIILDIDELEFLPRKRVNDALVVKSFLCHPLSEFSQSGFIINRPSHRFYVVHLSIESRTDECGRRVISMNSRSSC